MPLLTTLTASLQMPPGSDGSDPLNTYGERLCHILAWHRALAYRKRAPMTSRMDFVAGVLWSFVTSDWNQSRNASAINCWKKARVFIGSPCDGVFRRYGEVERCS